jgi:hypothetical protein
MSALAAYGRSARGLAVCVLQGVRDSLRLDATLVFFLSSVTVRVRAAQCLLLNGLIFLGSIFLADYVWAPLLGKILELSGGSSSAATASTGASIALPEESNLASWLHVLFLYAYQFLWLYPLYIISFILNTVWYQDIAGQTRRTRPRQQLRTWGGACSNSYVPSCPSCFLLLSRSCFHHAWRCGCDCRFEERCDVSEVGCDNE